MSRRDVSNYMRMMLVDDETDIVTVLKKGLEKHGGYVVDSFTNPSLALQVFKPGFYNLLLLDIKMPDIDGVELYRRLKVMDNKINVSGSKAIFLTAYESAEEEIRQEFPELDKSNFIRKPVRIMELVDRLKQALV